MNEREADTDVHDTDGHDTDGHDTDGHDTDGHDTDGHDTVVVPRTAGKPADRMVAVTAAFGAAMVVALFVVALAHRAPVTDVGVVVVADPRVPPGTAMPVRVLGVDARGRAAFTGTVDGALVDERGLATIARRASLSVTGAVADTPVSLTIDLAPAVGPRDDGLDVVPWSRSLALPAQGAAVYPERGAVTGRGSSRVLLIDDAGVRVVDIDGAANARLPDGRLLAIDREPLKAQLLTLAPAPGGDVTVDVAGVAENATLSLQLLVAGAARSLVDVRGPGSHALPLPADARDGDVVVVRVAASPLPSSAARVLVTRVGGLRHEDLRRVEPRLDQMAGDGVDDDLVRRALGARLRPRADQAPVISPSLHAQVARRQAENDVEAARWRERMRLAACAEWMLVVVAAVRAMRRLPVVAAGAIVVVLLMFAGLDLVLEAASPSLQVVPSPGAATTGEATTRGVEAGGEAPPAPPQDAGQ